jgi:hypothetical protein
VRGAVAGRNQRGAGDPTGWRTVVPEIPTDGRWDLRGGVDRLCPASGTGGARIAPLLLRNLRRRSLATQGRRAGAGDSDEGTPPAPARHRPVTPGTGLDRLALVPSRAVLAAVLAVALAAPVVLAAPEAAARTEAVSKTAGQKVRLSSFRSCAALVRYARRHALRNARGLIVPRQAPPQTGGGEERGAGGPVEGAPAPVQEEAGGQDHSGTNVQEVGVDEPDTVKTDGRRLFVIVGQALHAVDPRASAPARLGSLPLPERGYGHELLLHGDRALVFSNLGGGVDFAAAAGQALRPGVPQSLVTEVDVSDPAHMRVVRTLKVDGSYLSARLIGATARVVISSPPRALAATGVRALRRAGLSRWTPRATLSRRAGARRTTRRLVRCADVRRTAAFSGLDMVTVLTIDLSKGLPAVDSDAVLTDAETVYASPGSLYVATRRWLDPRVVAAGEPPAGMRTAIHRFDASRPGTTTYRSSGEVRGFLLSQWALSEHEGHLRVASTETPDWWGTPERESESHVTVLREQANRLAEVGRAGGLGRGERIYAVRFIGDTGYVVTFRETDPLYTIALADPARPRVLGELKILGYSAYLHPVGDGLLLGVGQDATDQGRRLGTQLSLFDVSDPSRPVRLHRHALASGSSSEVEYDHRAFLYWPATGLTVVPIEEWASGGREDEVFTGAVGFRVARGGIAPVGRLSHPAEPWVGRIRRSLVIGDRVFTVSDAGVLASPLATLAGGAWLSLSTSP